MNLQNIYEKYELTNEAKYQIGNTINKIMLKDKIPSEQPMAIIDIAPPGSGKTGLNGYALKQFKNDNLIIINNDELKLFHPRANEVAKLYPELYTKIVNEASKYWTDNLMDKVIKERLNVLYEGTGRKIEIFQNMISKMKRNGYTIIVRAMAVNELNCLMSMIERYEGQIKNKGWGRSVSLETFYKAYENEMLATVEKLENNKFVNKIEVFIRGKLPTSPVKIYSSFNKEFFSAKEAIITGRNIDKKSAKEYYAKYFVNRKFKKIYMEEKDILDKINILAI